MGAQSNYGVQEDLEFQCEVESVGAAKACSLIRIECPHFPLSDHPEAVLAALIRRWEKEYPDATVWLKVEKGDHLPWYIGDIWSALGDCSARLIITQGERASHAPGAQLEADFCAATIAHNPPVALWHPLAECLISAKGEAEILRTG